MAKHNKQNFDELQKEAEKKYKKREKKRKAKMRVSGVGIKTLQKIIIKKKYFGK